MNVDGKYYNGVSPVSVKVYCEVTANELRIFDSSTETLIATWSRENIFHDEAHNTAVVLGNKTDKSKIELSNHDVIKHLDVEKHMDHLVTADLKSIYKWVGVVVLAGIFFWFSIPRLSRVLARNVPFRYEVEASSHMKTNDFFPACKMSEAQKKALNTFTEFLYPLNPREKEMPVQISVADASMVNAYTLPGGKIILMKGLIQETKTPEELLGVIGHELGHVVARDTTVFLIRGGMLGAFFGFLTGDFHSTFAVSPQVLLSTAVLAFDRDMERAADAFAASKLKQLEVSTSGLRSFFSRRSYENSFQSPELLSTHPDYQARIVLIEETYPKKSLPKDIEDAWPVIKTICEK